MIFRWFGIISACLAVALPMGTLFYTLMYMETGGASGVPFGLSLFFAPFMFGIGLVLGAILQGIYNFVIAKSLFKKLEGYTIFRDENGSFLVFFEQKKIFHRLEIKLLEGMRYFIKHSVMENQNWCEKSSQEVSIDKPIHNISSLDVNLRLNTHWEAIFTFARFCAPLPLDDSQIILLHRGSFVNWELPLLNDSEIPKEIQLLQRQDSKTKIKRFFGIMGVIFAPVLCFYLYLQSAFYPCSIYNAVSQGDIKKIERLLKSGVNPNVKCQTKGVIADILKYIFFPLSEKGQTPLDRAIQDMKEAYYLWESPIISNDIITLLIESGAVIEKEKIDYLPLIFEYASKEVIELFLAKGAFNGSEEQSRSIALSALRRSAENIQEYEEIVELALSFVQSKELKQEILDRVFLYWSDSTNKMAILLKQGANINVTDENGESKLMEVLRAIPFTRNAEEIIFLIRNGIDVNIKNKHSNITALDIINRQKQKFEYDKVSSEVIEKLLYEKGAKSGAQLPK